MVKKDFETSYHEVIEGSSSKYIGLYSLTLDRTDVFHVKKDKKTGNILKLQFRFEIEGKVKLFVPHGNRVICDMKIYDGKRGELMQELKGFHLRNPLLSGLVIDKERLICTSIGSCGIKIFYWNGETYNSERMMYLKHRTIVKYKEDFVFALKLLDDGIYGICNDKLLKIDRELKNELFFN